MRTTILPALHLLPSLLPQVPHFLLQISILALLCCDLSARFNKLLLQ
jgi:hypothetical protein